MRSTRIPRPLEALFRLIKFCFLSSGRTDPRARTSGAVSRLAHGIAQVGAFPDTPIKTLDPIEGRFGLPRLQAIHRRLFQDMYAWAGELRTSPPFPVSTVKRGPSHQWQ